MKYCPACRKDFEEFPDGPPYSLHHVSEDEHHTHEDPECKLKDSDNAD